MVSLKTIGSNKCEKPGQCVCLKDARQTDAHCEKKLEKKLFYSGTR